MTRTLDRMSTLDAEFFYAEHDDVPMHIGSVAVFEGPAPIRQELMRLFEAKLPRVPRYRQVVRTAPFGPFRPVWTDDEDFNIRHHVRRSTVAGPGGPEQLRAVAAKLSARRPPEPTAWIPAPRPSHAELAADDVAFGVTADYDSSADLEVFVGGIRRGLAELSG